MLAFLHCNAHIMTMLACCFGTESVAAQAVNDAGGAATQKTNLSRSSLLERQWDSKKAHPVTGRERGPCKIREGWGGWVLAYLVLDGRQLLLFHSDGSSAKPSSSEKPHRKLELVGAVLAASRQQEIVLTPPQGATLTILARSERERDEWMVGLGCVPGIFRRLSDFYTIGGTFGQGSTCLVRECHSKHTGQRLALKTRLQKTRQSTQHMHNELRILQLCAKHPHPAIPHLHDHFYDPDGSIALVTDVMEGGELFDYIARLDRLTESEARKVFRSAVEGVAHLHALGVAHRDLKPENLMYTSPPEEGGQLKIMDYDLARVDDVQNWQGTTPCGSPHYLAPEIVRQQHYSQAVDVWSLGVILYILLAGRMPFVGKDDQATLAQIDKGVYSTSHKVWQVISPEAKDLLARLLQTDPKCRITAADCLRHAWLAPPPPPPVAFSTAASSSGTAASAAPARHAGVEAAAPAAPGEVGLTEGLLQDGEAELPSPANLRRALSQSERGRAMLARTWRRSVSGGSPRAAADDEPPRGSSPLREILGIDLEPLRQQAGMAVDAGLDAALRAGFDAPTGRFDSAGDALGAAPAGGVDAEDSNLGQLRSQLATIGTAGGLQDRWAMLVEGQMVCPSSPKLSPRMSLTQPETEQLLPCQLAI